MMVVSLGTIVSCSSSPKTGGENGTQDSIQSEDVEVVEESTESNSKTIADPQSLADKAVECFRTNTREDILDYCTESCAAKIKQQIATDEAMQNDRAFKDFREQMQKTTYTCSGMNDMGDTHKVAKYESSPRGYNLQVLLVNENGTWKIDQLGPGR